VNGPLGFKKTGGDWYHKSVERPRAPDPLLQVHGVPRKIMVEEHAGKLQIDALSTRSGADEHVRAVRAVSREVQRRQAWRQIPRRPLSVALPPFLPIHG